MLPPFYITPTRGPAYHERGRSWSRGSYEGTVVASLTVSLEPHEHLGFVQGLQVWIPQIDRDMLIDSSQGPLESPRGGCAGGLYCRDKTLTFTL